MLGVNASLWSDWTAACSHLPVTWWGVIFGDEVNASDLAKNRISPQRNHTHQQHIQKIDGNREPRVSITLTSLLNRNRHFFRGGGVNPISPPFTLAIYTHTTQSKRWTATENQDFQLHWHFYWTVTNFCWGGAIWKGGDIPLPPSPHLLT